MDKLLYTIALILIILWAIGYVGYGAGGLLHGILVVAVVVIVVRLIQGRRL